MTPLKRYLIILLFMIIGIGFGIGFGIAFYYIRKKDDDQISMGGSIKNTIIPSTFFWIAIGIIIIVKMEYCIHVQLFILSAIVLAGFLSAISTKKAWMFFLVFGVVVVELGLEALIRRFVEWVNCTNEKRKAKMLAEAASKFIAPPEPSAPQIENLNINNQKNIYNELGRSALPLNNNLIQPSASQPSAPPLNN